MVVATGALVPRDLPIPGRDLPGVHFAMEYLVQQNKVGAGDTIPSQITAEDKHVVLGAADTFRAAAADQLQTWGSRVGADTVRGPEGGDPADAHQAMAAG